MKIGLVGSSDIGKYSIADILWKKISELSNTDLEFEFIPIDNFTELCRFYWGYYENKNLLGFNVALPWKTEMAKLVGSKDERSKSFESINVVYRTDRGATSSNTDVIGVEKSILNLIGDISNRKVLVLGAGGAGLPVSIYLAEKYRCAVHVYDTKEVGDLPPTLKKLVSQQEIETNTYDLIINATPVGKYYLDRIPEQFSLPLGIDLIEKITHRGSVIQEMNYFPFQTQILKFAKIKKLTTISGVDMLVYQALETFRLYTGNEIGHEESRKLLDFMRKYSLDKENELLR